MFGFLKKLFGVKPTVNPCGDAPYKIEAPAVPVQTVTPEPKQPVQTQQAQKQKKPAQPRQSTGKPRGRKPKVK